MTIVPITTRTPACLGVMCRLHAQCVRYAAVEDAGSHLHTIATCVDGELHPLFVDAGTTGPVRQDASHA